MHGIGQEVHSLVGRVIPWEGVAMPPWHTDYGTAALVFTLVWVSQNTQRLILVQGASGTHDATPEQAAAHTQVVARVSRTQIAAPTEFVEALANLRRGLMLLQRRLPPSTIPKQPPAHRRPR